MCHRIKPPATGDINLCFPVYLFDSRAFVYRYQDREDRKSISEEARIKQRIVSIPLFRSSAPPNFLYIPADGPQSGYAAAISACLMGPSDGVCGKADPPIQTGADFLSAGNIDNRFSKGKKQENRDMMTRIRIATEGRVQTDPRIDLMGERVDRVWADPILSPRKGIDH
jgi:hypothetical protein